MDFKTDIDFRKKSLKKLLNVIISYEDQILEALHKDLKKPAFEAFLTESNYVITDLKETISNINKWAKPKKVWPSMLNFPSSDYIYSEPYGNVLIFAPYNYPFQLAFCPLIAAVAAGNKVTLKPSELTPNTSSLISKIIRETFQPTHVVAILGDASVAEDLLKKHWDYIFFTGSVAVGKIVAKAAAENLTPTTLELGGKSPCIVDQTANLELAAKRIVWGKYINAGQTCIAPDYILVDQKVKTQFVKHLINEIKLAYGEDMMESPDFGRIINHKNFDRLYDLIQDQRIIFGGQNHRDNLFFAPTLLDNPSLESQVMKEEIFGPILPIVSYDTKSEVEQIILSFSKPLALYLFSEDETYIEQVLTKFSFGGGCINDTVIHLANNRLPFGGVGNSGIGAYHGKFSFDTFSHKKSIVKKANWLDIPLRYAPYNNKLKKIQKLLKWF